MTNGFPTTGVTPMTNGVQMTKAVRMTKAMNSKAARVVTASLIQDHQGPQLQNEA